MQETAVRKSAEVSLCINDGAGLSAERFAEVAAEILAEEAEKGFEEVCDISAQIPCRP